MFSVLRALAPAMLLVALMSGHAASGLVIAHVALDHVTVAAHDHHGDESGGEHHHEDASHGEDHSHELTLASHQPARTVDASLTLQPLSAVLRYATTIPDGYSLRHSTPPPHRQHRVAPARHSILRI